MLCSIVTRPSLAPSAQLIASALTILALSAAPSALPAQNEQPPVRIGATVSDSIRDSSSDTTARRIESVLVTGIRAGSDAPIAQKTLNRATIAARHFGQDVPMLLMQTAPSLSAYAESGTLWGYSHLRLRGLDETRINVTIDGIPLNDPEDQVLYFANLADLMGSVESVQIQRGIGTSTSGTASYAGSINFETIPVARKERSGSAELQIGSFGSQRGSVSFSSGLGTNKLAAYGRASVLRTNGYRDHSGVLGSSALLGAGWFGERDVVKLTAMAGKLKDTLAYSGATAAELAENWRYNPLSADERDSFGQQLLALSWTHGMLDGSSLSTTVYRNSASGAYDWFYLPDRYRFSLAHTWYGITSGWNGERGPWHLNAGLNANTYKRTHGGSLEPDITLYHNTGHKQDASVFLKTSLQTGRARWFTDVQARWAHFAYDPSVDAGIDKSDVSWAFLNPRAGVAVDLKPRLSLWASYGITGREPARSDLFAGDDDLNADNVAELGDFTRIKPERLGDTELGIRYDNSKLILSANLYDMEFRNTLAPVGAPLASGAIPRHSVGRSYRRGVELDLAYQGVEHLLLGMNATWSDNRIRQYVDSSEGSLVTYDNVQPMLTPRFMSSHHVEYRLSPLLGMGLEGRYQSAAYLDNTGSSERRIPDYYTLDASLRTRLYGLDLVLRGVNLGDTHKYGSGEVSYGELRYFVLPGRAFFLTVGRSF